MFPTFIPPIAAKNVQTLPEGDQWVYEVKFDGYRALVMKDGPKIQIRSRNNIRGDAWVKLKLDRQQEFVIGGYRPGPHGVDALLVGFYEGRKLRFAREGARGLDAPPAEGVVREAQASAHDPLAFTDLPNSKTSHWGGCVTAEQMSEMQWVKPKLVAQIRFVEWTTDDHLRHAAFLGLREDKEAREVRRESRP